MPVSMYARREYVHGLSCLRLLALSISMISLIASPRSEMRGCGRRTILTLLNRFFSGSMFFQGSRICVARLVARKIDKFDVEALAQVAHEHPVYIGNLLLLFQIGR